MLIDVIRTITVIVGGLIAGYLARKSGRLRADHAPTVNSWALVWLQPVAICLSLWGLKDPSWRTLFLPIYAAALILAMWPVGALVGRSLRLDRPSMGAFVISGMFSNVGFTYGTFLAFVRLGDEGAALGSIYCLSFMPLVYTLGFIVSGRYAPDRPLSGAEMLRETFIKPESRNPILGIALGAGLHFVGPPRPEALSLITDVTIATTTAAFLFAIGLGMRLSTVRHYVRECVLMHGLKFVVSPIVGLGLAYLFGYFHPGNSHLLQVSLIEAAAPTAVMSIVLTQVFRQNRDLVNALWLTSNLTSVVLAPVILYVARAMG